MRQRNKGCERQREIPYLGKKLKGRLLVIAFPKYFRANVFSLGFLL